MSCTGSTRQAGVFKILILHNPSYNKQLLENPVSVMDLPSFSVNNAFALTTISVFYLLDFKFDEWAGTA